MCRERSTLTSIRNPFAQRTIEYFQQVLGDIFNQVDAAATTQSGAYTTDSKLARELVIADKTTTGTQTITLHSGARDLQVRTLKKDASHGGTLQAATEGSETIDGSATDTVTDVTSYQWTDAKGEWSKV